MKSHTTFALIAATATLCSAFASSPQARAATAKAARNGGASRMSGTSRAAAAIRKAPTTRQPKAPTGGAAPVRTVGSTGSIALTIYNQNFAVVRHPVRVPLKKGANKIRFENVSSLLESDSVVLRDITGKRDFRILEQSYRNDTASIERLLPLFEGKTLQFLASGNPNLTPSNIAPRIITGKLIRAGTTANLGYSGGFPSAQYRTSIVEVDGKLRFDLPGTPIFPPASLTGLLLTPSLEWTLATQTPGPLNAELAYITSGFSWQASYNLVAPERGDTIDLIGWVTMNNTSGRSYPNARIQLLAGNVRKLQPSGGGGGFSSAGGGFGGIGGGEPPPVTEKGFDEYHLYTLRHPTTLPERGLKQVEMARAAGIASRRIFVYDAERGDPYRYDWLSPIYGDDLAYDASEPKHNTRVWVMREFANTAANGLGIPLPKGRMRVYRREDQTGALQFVGESNIGHTPKDETVRLYTGDAFDVVGERRNVSVAAVKRHDTSYRRQNWEIKLRNHKKEAVEVRVVEHMHPFRTISSFWEIVSSSDPWTKLSAFTIEFRVTVKPNEEKVITYSVDY